MQLGSGAAMAVVYRLAAAALIRLLAWKLPYAVGTTAKNRTTMENKMKVFQALTTLNKDTEVESAWHSTEMSVFVLWGKW